MNFTKKEKKEVRRLIQLALIREFDDHINKLESYIKYYRQKKYETKETYYKIFDKVTEFDKHIAFFYDGIGGGRYESTIIYLLRNSIIKEDDMKDFREESKKQIVAKANIFTD